MDAYRTVVVIVFGHGNVVSTLGSVILVTPVEEHASVVYFGLTEIIEIMQVITLIICQMISAAFTIFREILSRQHPSP